MKRGEIWTVFGGKDYAGKHRPGVILQARISILKCDCKPSESRAGELIPRVGYTRDQAHFALNQLPDQWVQSQLTNIIGQGLRLALAGLAIGVAAALIVNRVVASFSHLLSGVSASDPLTFIAVSLVLTSAAVLACYVPARRAMRVDPIAALRHE